MHFKILPQAETTAIHASQVESVKTVRKSKEKKAACKADQMFRQLESEKTFKYSTLLNFVFSMCSTISKKKRLKKGGKAKCDFKPQNTENYRKTTLLSVFPSRCLLKILIFSQNLAEPTEVFREIIQEQISFVVLRCQK